MFSVAIYALTVVQFNLLSITIQYDQQGSNVVVTLPKKQQIKRKKLNIKETSKSKNNPKGCLTEVTTTEILKKKLGL
jgi:hypothetical protein